MTRLYKYAVLIGAMVCILAAPGVGSTLPPTCDLQLVAMINQARTAPLETAAAYGLDSETVLSRLPEMEDILLSGLPPVHYNQALSTAARAHTLDMVERNYYAKTSPEGQTLEDRIALAGYAPSAAGENLGMIGFINYLARETAVEQIFRNMFLDELDPESTEPRMILNPDMEDIGVAVSAGQWTMGRAVYNVYLAACDFAASRVSETELDLFRLINLARTWPLAAAPAMGIAPEAVSSVPGMAPVALDGRLVAAAGGHADDILARNYISTVTPEGMTPGDRMRENGYAPGVFDEFLASRITAGEETPDTVALSIIASKLQAEMTAPAGTAGQLLNPAFQDMGLRSVSLALAGETEDDAGGYHLLVADITAPAAPEAPRLLVFGYADVNGNGVADAGEGLEGISFCLSDAKGNVLTTETGKGGNFGMALEPGLYRLTVPNATGEGISESVDIEIIDRNVALWLSGGMGID